MLTRLHLLQALLCNAGSDAANGTKANGNSRKLDRHTVEAAYATFRGMEAPLQEQLISLLNKKSDVSIIGPAHADVDTRVPTVSFVHKSKSSAELNTAIQQAGFAIRHGHMYAMRLTERLVEEKLVRSPGDGVVRISLLHYNTTEEVQQLVKALDSIL